MRLFSLPNVERQSEGEALLRMALRATNASAAVLLLLNRNEATGVARIGLSDEDAPAIKALADRFRFVVSPQLFAIEELEKESRKPATNGTLSAYVITLGRDFHLYQSDG